MKKISVLLFALALITACVYPFEVESTEVEKIVVIDGDILIGQVSRFTTRYVSVLNQNYLDKAYGKMWVECSDGRKYMPASAADNFSFEIDLTQALVHGQYRIVFECTDLEKTYSSAWVDVAPSPDGVRLSYQKKEASIIIVASMQTLEDVAYVRTTYDQIWEYTSYWKKTLEYDPETMAITELLFPDETYYYCWDHSSPSESHISSNYGKKKKRIENAVITEIDRSDIRLSKLYRCHARIYGITKEHYDYLESLKKVDQVGESLFSPTPSEPRGNITCEQNPQEMVIGYVGASAFADASIDIYGTSVYKPINYEQFLFVPEEDVPVSSYYDVGQVPVKIGNGGVYLWGSLRCIDCRAFGGTKDKPEGWPTGNK